MNSNFYEFNIIIWSALYNDLLHAQVKNQDLLGKISTVFVQLTFQTCFFSPFSKAVIH